MKPIPIDLARSLKSATHLQHEARQNLLSAQSDAAVEQAANNYLVATDVLFETAEQIKKVSG